MPPKKFKTILQFVRENNHIRNLVIYIKELDKKGVNLEDLTDIIDDSSQEIDAYIQLLIPARDLIRILSSMEHGKVQ